MDDRMRWPWTYEDTLISTRIGDRTGVRVYVGDEDRDADIMRLRTLAKQRGATPREIQENVLSLEATP